ncbi:MAG TPA: glycoside hydrolase family 36 N-terminal domain-containing protein, partial [Acidimicrobiales bacterium]
MTIERVSIVAGEWGIELAAEPGGPLHQVAFGPPPDPAAAPAGDLAFPLALYPRAYPTYGDEPLRDPALRVTHADGSTITRLAFDGHHSEPTDQGEAHTVTLRDPVAGLTVRLAFATHAAHGVIEQWAEVAN